MHRLRPLRKESVVALIMWGPEEDSNPDGQTVVLVLLSEFE